MDEVRLDDTHRALRIRKRLRQEVTFSHHGERGVIDILAWHPQTRSLSIVGLKTELVDPQELVAVMHRRLRAPQGTVSGPSFWSSVTSGGLRPSTGATRRVRRSVERPSPSTSITLGA